MWRFASRAVFQSIIILLLNIGGKCSHLGSVSLLVMAIDELRAIYKPNKRQEDRLAITAPQCAIMQI